MSYFNIVTQQNDSTVVSEYKPVKSKSFAYQSEAELEKEFIELLVEQKYEYLKIHHENDLISNLRKCIEELNKYTFTDDEWNKFFNDFISNPNLGIVEKTKSIQEDYIKPFKRAGETVKNIKLIDKDNIHNNKLQVINQYVVDDGKHPNRYDVTVLVNGLPLVHIELKRRGVALKTAFDQIDKYQRDSFWAGTGLYEYIQIFVISNGTNTKYYSNTTRFNHVKKNNRTKTSHSFEFTSFWADGNNKMIPDLVDFTRTFFAKHTILNILTKYCVFNAENLLLVMRPYQITATERILNRIEIANNYKKYGTVEGGGYIWHTTGSGKTLTSFKTAKLACDIPYIDKVLFVVDRKDLDYQTMREYDKFEKGSANSNKSTAVLTKQLEDEKSKIIITTIQKLSTFISKNPKHDVYQKHFVIIFDECHRSQFGEMHKDITAKFKNYHIFGFTGTPIFAENATNRKNVKLQTTEQAFGDKLHTYTIIDAINDKNVLPFKVDFHKTFDFEEDDVEDEKVNNIDREKAYYDPRRIDLITEYIVKNFSKKTYRNEQYFSHTIVTNVADVSSTKDRTKAEEIKQKVMVGGFNSIFAVASIEMAKLYYLAFKKHFETHPEKKLNVALIYSYGANEEEADGIIDEENSDDTIGLDDSSRDFLDKAIKDYNEMFKTNYDTSADRFQNYYKDVSLRMKNKEIDILIVVNMFLTGFDATTLNTLWVDKRLKMHGLIQAYSRTNRILNSIKTFGNIVCFRNLKKATDEAVSLFGDKDASGLVLLKGFKDYYEGYIDEKGIEHKGYKPLIEELLSKFPLDEPYIIGEKNQKDFIKLFGAILRARNILVSFDEFDGLQIISERDLQDYTGRYLDLMPPKGQDSENINDDITFELELIKQIEINIDYILLLVKKYHDDNCRDKEIVLSIIKAIDSSPELRSKKELIMNFVEKVNTIENEITDEWKNYVEEQKEKELQEIISSENLKEKETRKFIADAFENGEVKTTGTDIEKILPPTSMFGGGNHKLKKLNVIEKILIFFERFFGIGM